MITHKTKISIKTKEGVSMRSHHSKSHHVLPEESPQDHRKLERKKSNHHLQIDAKVMLPVNDMQVSELIKKAATKCNDLKLGMSASQYLRVSLSSGDFSLIIIPKVNRDDVVTRADSKLAQQFIDTRSIILLDYNNVLGEGAQGKVIMGYNLVTKEPIAVKLSKTYGVELAKKQLKREQSNLELMGRLVGACALYDETDKQDSEKTEATLMRYCHGQTLKSYTYEINKKKSKEDAGYFAKKKPINIFNKVSIILQMIKQLSLLHKNNLIHRDIKLENFIIDDLEDNNFDVTLIDLGDAIPATEINRLYASTFGYGPPEVWEMPAKRLPYSRQSDYFSLGVAIAELLSNENYQAKLKDKKASQISKDTLSELSRHDIYSMLSDVFIDQSILSTTRQTDVPQDYDFNLLANHLDNVIYEKWMKHRVHALLLSLTKEAPQQRLSGTDLESEFAQLKKLYQNCTLVSNSMHVMAREIIYVCDALESADMIINKQLIYQHFMTHLKSLVHEAKIEKEIYDLPAELMEKAAQKCITFFSSNYTGSLAYSSAQEKPTL